jgi:hypothetical protein
LDVREVRSVLVAKLEEALYSLSTGRKLVQVQVLYPEPINVAGGYLAITIFLTCTSPADSSRAK